MNEGSFNISDEERVELLSRAGAISEADAKVMLEQLMGLGYTLYRKRIFKQPTRRTTARRMTKELAAAIRAYVGDHPEKNQLEVGIHFGVNPGRVSEALNGLR